MIRGGGLQLFIGNRLESLADALADNVREPLGSPLAPEIIMIQSKGMQKWLSLTLAHKLGICGNCQFPFPNKLVQDLFTAVTGNYDTSPLFERDVLSFRLFQLLPESLNAPDFSPLKNYLGDEALSLKSFQMVRRLANLFDQYQTFRPDMLFDWEESDHGGWQGELWRKIAKADPSSHRAALQRAFLDLCRQEGADVEGFPARISVFGVSTLPRYHIEVLAAAAEYTSVSLYLLNPCREYWFDIVSNKTNARLQAKEDPAGVSYDSLHYETGHPLLASFGAAGREFFATLLDCGDYQEHLLFDETTEKTLLTSLQGDIDHCRQPDKNAKKAIAAGDDSLQIHSCHTPLREMEALYDFLLRCFDTLPGLQPSDILVMTPDIEDYTPYITAVFDSGEDGSRRIPIAITDRKRREANRIARYFFTLLGLHNYRFEVSRVMDLFESPDIQRRFETGSQELELVHHWLSETRIRWGIDAEDRAARGLPEYRDNSWKAGLDRLLLGTALRGNGRQLYRGILPYEDIEGSAALLLGKFIDFIDRLATAVSTMESRQTLSEWVAWLGKLLEEFFLPDDETENDYLELENLFHELQTTGELSGFNRPVALDIIEAFLEETLASGSGSSARFLSGGVTFCAMLPMRSIPFRVIAVVGLNDKRFPRRAAPLNFDLMARHPRPGDRSLRQEDKYLFLETLISAREKFFISYLGQDIHDNSEIQPSLVVTELLDYIIGNYRSEDSRQALCEQILFRHPLQAFDAAYFRKENRLFSYSRENLEALLSAHRHRGEKVFATKPLPVPEDEWQSLEIPALLSFYSHPARFFSRQRLGIYLEGESAALDDRESFVVRGLERYEVGSFLTKSLLTSGDPAADYPALREKGILPPGVCGKLALRDLTKEAGGLAQRILTAVAGKEEKAAVIDEKIADFHLFGRITGIYGEKLVRHRFARIKAADQLKVWLELLILQVAGAPGLPSQATLIGLDSSWEWSAPAEARPLLEDLLTLYRQGLTVPLRFFSESSLAFTSGLMQKPDHPQAALKAARKKWEADSFSPGKSESESPYNQFCFREMNPLNEEFQSLALRVYRPMLEACRSKGEGVP